MAGSLWRQKLESTVATQITDGAGYDYQPDWSPDGKSVVYVSYQKDAMELWLLDLGSGKTHALTSGGAVNVEPRWSPDGKKIVWTSTEYNKRFHIFAAEVVNGELKNKVRLTGETKSSLPRYYYSSYDMEINPTWTRDGKEILFVSNRGHIHGTGGFWKMKVGELSKYEESLLKRECPTCAEAKEIHYEETNWKARPELSPDGSRMVYSSYVGRQWHNLWLMPAGGGDAFPISYGDWDETNVRWSPDGTKLAYICNSKGNSEIRLKDFPWGETKTLTFGPSQKTPQKVNLALRVQDENGNDLPARISIKGEDGRFYGPDGALWFADDGYDRSTDSFERHYFYTSGREQITLPVNLFKVEVTAGYDRTPSPTNGGVFATGPNRFMPYAFNPKFKLSDDAGSWVSGDMHVHMNYGGTTGTSWQIWQQ